MNTKGNQRAVETENRIKYVFLNLLKEKDISRISVSDICRQAGIHRTTFYVHYKDVADLMEHLVTEMYQQVMGLFVEEGKGMRAEGFRDLFELIQKHRAFFCTYMDALGKMDLTYDSMLPGKNCSITRPFSRRGCPRLSADGSGGAARRARRRWNGSWWRNTGPTGSFFSKPPCIPPHHHA